jgi:uncharacterized protein YndB with AHSA1/START domain
MNRIQKEKDDRTLSIQRVIHAPPGLVFRAWTEPELLKQWFTPRPWTTSEVVLDVRPGGSNRIVMRNPEGEEFPNTGVYLLIDPGKRVVFTDAYTSAWQPSEKPMMTVDIRFIPIPEGTLYTAEVSHWSSADREAHEQMGFYEGWGICAAQLAELLEGMCQSVPAATGGDISLLLSQLASPAQRAILQQGVRSLADLAEYNEMEVASWHGIGQSALAVIREVLAMNGLSLK